MGQVDDFQEGAERVAQLAEESERVERDRKATELSMPPVKPTASLRRRRAAVRISSIVTPLANIRTGALPDIHELALSIKERGLLAPLTVRQSPHADSEEDATFELVAGARRLQALRTLHDDDAEVDVLILERLSDEEAYELMLLENAQRVPLEPMQAARALRMLMHKQDATSAAQLARSLGLSVDWVRRHLRLLELPESVQQRLESGDLSFTVADLLRKGQASGRLDIVEVDQLAHAAVDGSISAREIAAKVNPPRSRADITDGPQASRDDLETLPGGLGSREDIERVAALDRAATELLQTSEPAQAVGSGDQNGPTRSSAEPQHPAAVDADGDHEPPWAQLDAYLLARVVSEIAGDDVRAALSVGDDCLEWALEVPPAERIVILRRVARDVLRVDPKAPDEMRIGAEGAQL